MNWRATEPLRAGERTNTQTCLRVIYPFTELVLEFMQPYTNRMVQSSNFTEHVTLLARSITDQANPDKASINASDKKKSSVIMNFVIAQTIDCGSTVGLAKPCWCTTLHDAKLIITCLKSHWRVGLFSRIRYKLV